MKAIILGIPRLASLSVAIKYVAVLALIATIATIGIFAGPDRSVEAQDDSPVKAWSDAPDRIVVYWGDPTDLDTYGDAFKEGEQYVVRWKREGTVTWNYVDVKSDSSMLDGNAAVGDPDLVIKLPQEDPEANYDVNIIRATDPMTSCMTSGKITDLPANCVSLGTTNVTTNDDRTSGEDDTRSEFFQSTTPTGIMYMSDGRSDSMYTVDRSTGAITLVGGSGDGSTGISNPGSIVWDGTNMYGEDDDNDEMYSVDLDTGMWTRIGPTGISAPQDMMWNGTTIYGIGATGTHPTYNSGLYSINLNTGAWTRIGSAISSGRRIVSGIVWDGSTAYFSQVDSFSRAATWHTIDDLTSAESTYVRGITGVVNIRGLAWDGTTMYGAYLWQLYTIDKSNGRVTTLGSPVNNRQGLINGLAWVPNPQDNADLSALAVSPGTLTPAFDKDRTQPYAISVSNSVSQITITATTDDSDATLTINGDTVTSGMGKTVSLNAGTNTINIVVTAEDESTTRGYEIKVTRAPSTPTGLSCSVTDNSIIYRWAATPGASGYTIQHGQVGGSIVTSTSTTNSFAPPGNEPANTAYRFRVLARNAADSSSYSPSASTFHTAGCRTLQPPASAIGSGYTNLTSSSVTLNATVANPVSAGNKVWYRVRKSGSATTAQSGQFSGTATTTNKNVSVDITGLDASTDYQVDLSTDGAPNSQTNDITFTTFAAIVPFTGTNSQVTVTEGSSVGSISIRLINRTAPTGITYGLVSSCPTKLTVPATVNLANGSHTATITGAGVVNNSIDEDSVTCMITATPVLAGWSETGVDVDVLVQDDDTAAIIINPAAGVADFNENVDSAPYTFRLETEPTHNVTIVVTSVGTDPGTVEVRRNSDSGLQNSFTLTPGNYGNRTIKLRPIASVNNADYTNRTTTILHTVSSSDPKYSSSLNESFDIVVINDDNPPKPTNLDARSNFESLELDWDHTISGAVVGDDDITVIGYDVHYTSAAIVDVANDADASGNDPKTAWVDANYTGTASEHTISGLDNDTLYRVRVRTRHEGISSLVDSDWAFDTGTPTLLGKRYNISAPAAKIAEGETLPFTINLGENAPTDGILFTITCGDAVGSTGSCAKLTLPSPSTVTVPSGMKRVGFDITAKRNNTTGEAATTAVIGVTTSVADWDAGNLPSKGITINDNTVTVQFTASTYTVDEEDAGSDENTITIQVNVSPALVTGVNELKIPITHVNGNGASSADYSLSGTDYDGTTTPPTITLSAGDGSMTGVITFTATSDMIDDDAETVAFTLGTAPLGSIVTQTAKVTTITITDNDTADITSNIMGSATIEEEDDPTGVVTAAKEHELKRSIKLDTEPINNVTVTITSSDTDSLKFVNKDDTTMTVNGPITHIFTSSNWTMPYTFTVRAVRDTDHYTNKMVDVTYALTGTESTDPDYNGETSTVMVTINNTDDASAVTGLGTSPSHEQLTASWTSAGTVTGYDVHYTSALKTGSSPVADNAAVQTGVNPNPSSGWVNAGQSMTTSHTITGLSNGTPYRVRVRAVYAKGSNTEETTWTHTTGTPVLDGKRFTLSPSAATIPEGGTTTFTVNLGDPAPTGGLEITVGCTSGPCAGRASGIIKSGGGNETFTIMEGDTKDTFDITAQLNANMDDNATVVMNIDTTADGWEAGGNDTSTITIQDNTIELRFAALTYTVNEGSDATVTVNTVMNTPTLKTGGGNRTITITPTTTGTANTAGSDDYTIPGSITFAPGDSSKTFTFASTADDLDEDNEFVRLMLNTTAGVKLGSPHITRVTITDDDMAGTTLTGDNPVTLSEIDDPVTVTSAVKENEEDYTIKLDSEPTHDVTMTLTSSDTDSVVFVDDSNMNTNGPLTLTFTPDNWGMAQRFTIRAVQDTDHYVDKSGLKITYATTSTDGDYNNVSTDITVGVSNTDDIDESDFNLSVTSGHEQLTANWNDYGTVTRYEVQYTTSTVGDQVAALTGGSPDLSMGWVNLGTTNNNSYIIRNLTNGINYRVRVRAVYVKEGVTDETNWAVGSGTPMLLGKRYSLSVGTTDTIYEGEIKQLTIDLGEDAPTTNGITFMISCSGACDRITHPESIKIESGNEGTFTVTALRNATASEGDTTAIITITTAATGWTAEDGTNSASGTLTIKDNTVTLSFVAPTPDTVAEDNPTANPVTGNDISIKVNVNPMLATGVSDFEVDIEILADQTTATYGGSTVDGGDYVLKDSTGSAMSISNNRVKLTFAAGESSKTITFTTTPDKIDEDKETVTLRLVIPAVGAVAGDDNTLIALSITDNDEAGITETVPDETVVKNEGAITSYTIKLDTKPTHDVTVAVTSVDATAAGVSCTIPTTTPTASCALTFTPTNWNTAQTVTVTGIIDSDHYFNKENITVSHSVTSTDTKYNGMLISNANLTINNTHDAPDVDLRLAGRHERLVANWGQQDVKGYEVHYTSELNESTLADDEDDPTKITTDASLHATKWVVVRASSAEDTSSTHTISGLTNDEKYRVRVRAIAELGADPDNGDWNVKSGMPMLFGTIYSLSLSPGESGTINEGESTELTVTLGQDAPTGGIEFSVSCSGTDCDDVELEKPTITIEEGEERTGTVTINALRDNDKTGDDNATISVSTTESGWTSSGDNSEAIIINDTTRTIRFASGTYGISEDSGSIPITIGLDGALAPGSDVTIPITTLSEGTDATYGDSTVNGGDYTVAPGGSSATITFQAGDSSAILTFTSTADQVDEDNETVQFRIGAIRAGSGIILGSPSETTITITDDDETAGIVFFGLTDTNANGIEDTIEIDEADDSTTSMVVENVNTYTVKLTSKPTANVTIALTRASAGTNTADISCGSISTPSSSCALIFTPDNWNTPKMVTVTGVADGAGTFADPDTNTAASTRNTTIVHVISSSDNKYNVVPNRSVTVTVTDVKINEEPEFAEMTLSRDVDENTSLGQNIGDPVTATDPDNDKLVYSLSGTDAASFSINASTGRLQTKAALDFETKKSYEVNVEVSDNKADDGANDSSSDDNIKVTINIGNADEREIIKQTSLLPNEVGKSIVVELTGGDITDDNRGNIMDSSIKWKWESSINGDFSNPTPTPLCDPCATVIRNNLQDDNPRSSYNPTVDDIGKFIRVTATYGMIPQPGIVGQATPSDDFSPPAHPKLGTSVEVNDAGEIIYVTDIILLGTVGGEIPGPTDLGQLEFIFERFGAPICDNDCFSVMPIDNRSDTDEYQYNFKVTYKWTHDEFLLGQSVYGTRTVPDGYTTDQYGNTSTKYRTESARPYGTSEFTWNENLLIPAAENQNGNNVDGTIRSGAIIIPPPIACNISIGPAIGPPAIITECVDTIEITSVVATVTLITEDTIIRRFSNESNPVSTDSTGDTKLWTTSNSKPHGTVTVTGTGGEPRHQGRDRSYAISHDDDSGFRITLDNVYPSVPGERRIEPKLDSMVGTARGNRITITTADHSNPNPSGSDIIPGESNTPSFTIQNTEVGRRWLCGSPDLSMCTGRHNTNTGDAAVDEANRQKNEYERNLWQTIYPITVRQLAAPGPSISRELPDLLTQDLLIIIEKKDSDPSNFYRLEDTGHTVTIHSIGANQSSRYMEDPGTFRAAIRDINPLDVVEPLERAEVGFMGTLFPLNSVTYMGSNTIIDFGPPCPPPTWKIAGYSVHSPDFVKSRNNAVDINATIEEINRRGPPVQTSKAALENISLECKTNQPTPEPGRPFVPHQPVGILTIEGSSFTNSVIRIRAENLSTRAGGAVDPQDLAGPPNPRATLTPAQLRAKHSQAAGGVNVLTDASGNPVLTDSQRQKQAGDVVGYHAQGSLKRTICAMPDMVLGPGACVPMVVILSPLIAVIMMFTLFGIKNPMVLSGVGMVVMIFMSAIIMPTPIMIGGFIVAAFGVGVWLLILRR